MKVRRRRKGVTLIETLFAVFLVVVCAVVMTTTMPIATKSRAKADLQNKAVGIAQKQLEALKGVGYANLTASQMASFGLIDSATPIAANQYSASNVDGANLDNVAAILPQGASTVTVEQLAIDLRRVTIRVTWVDRNQQREVRLGTLVANL